MAEAEDIRPGLHPGTWYLVESPGMDAIRAKLVDIDTTTSPVMLWLQRQGEARPLMVTMGPGMRVTPIDAPAEGTSGRGSVRVTDDTGAERLVPRRPRSGEHGGGTEGG